MLRQFRKHLVLSSILCILATSSSSSAQEARPGRQTDELLKSANSLFNKNQMDGARPLYVVILQREEAGTELWRDAADKLALSFFAPGGVLLPEYRAWAESKYRDADTQGLILLALADYLWQNGNDEGALNELGALPDGNGLLAQSAQILKAQCLSGLGKGTEALDILDGVVADGDEIVVARALYVAGEMRLGMAMPDVARATLERLISTHPQSIWALPAKESLDRIAAMKLSQPSATTGFPLKNARMRVPTAVMIGQGNAIWEKVIADGIKRGDELAAAGNVEESRSAYGRLLGLSGGPHLLAPAADKIVQSFMVDGALNETECREWITKHLTDEAQRHRVEVAIARSHYRRQDYDTALALLQPLCEPNCPVHVEASELTGLCLLGKGDREAAMDILVAVAGEAGKEDEAGARSLLVLGWLHLQNQAYGPAKAAMSDLIERYPSSPLVKKARELDARLTVLDN